MQFLMWIKGSIFLKRTVLTIGTVAVVTLGSTFAIKSPSVYAEPTIDEVSEQQDDVKDKLSKAESKIADVLYEIKDINEEIDRLDEALDKNKDEIKKNEKELGTLEEEIDELNTKIEKRNDILKDRLSSYQESGGNIDYLEVALGSKNFSEFISRLSAVSSIANADAELIEENVNDKAAIEDKKEEKDAVAKELNQQEETISTQKEQQKESKATLKEKEEKVKDDIANLEDKSSELEALESEIRTSIEEPEPTQVAAETTENNDSGSSDAESSNTVSTNTVSSGTSGSNGGNSNSGGSSSKKSSDGGSVAVSKGGSATSVGTQFIGKSTYSWGSKNPEAGLFDCSGFVQWAYEQEGVSLPRATGGQAGAGKEVSYSSAQPGDLVFFLGGSHVGIYLGGGKFIGSQTSTGVAIADMDSGYWAQNFDGKVRRVK